MCYLDFIDHERRMHEVRDAIYNIVMRTTDQGELDAYIHRIAYSYNKKSLGQFNPMNSHMAFLTRTPESWDILQAAFTIRERVYALSGIYYILRDIPEDLFSREEYQMIECVRVLLYVSLHEMNKHYPIFDRKNVAYCDTSLLQYFDGGKYRTVEEIPDTIADEIIESERIRFQEMIANIEGGLR
jgi:hypothetical protein